MPSKFVNSLLALLVLGTVVRANLGQGVNQNPGLGQGYGNNNQKVDQGYYNNQGNNPPNPGIGQGYQPNNNNQGLGQAINRGTYQNGYASLGREKELGEVPARQSGLGQSVQAGYVDGSFSGIGAQQHRGKRGNAMVEEPEDEPRIRVTRSPKDLGQKIQDEPEPNFQPSEVGQTSPGIGQEDQNVDLGQTLVQESIDLENKKLGQEAQQSLGVGGQTTGQEIQTLGSQTIGQENQNSESQSIGQENTESQSIGQENTKSQTIGQEAQPSPDARESLGQKTQPSLGVQIGQAVRAKRYTEREPYRKTCNSYYGKYICYRLYENEAAIPNDFTCWSTYLGKKNCTETENVLYLDRRNVEVDPSELNRQFYVEEGGERRPLQNSRVAHTGRDHFRQRSGQDDEFGAVEKNLHNRRTGDRELPSDDRREYRPNAPNEQRSSARVYDDRELQRGN